MQTTKVFDHLVVFKGNYVFGISPSEEQRVIDCGSYLVGIHRDDPLNYIYAGTKRVYTWDDFSDLIMNRLPALDRKYRKLFDDHTFFRQNKRRFPIDVSVENMLVLHGIATLSSLECENVVEAYRSIMQQCAVMDIFQGMTEEEKETYKDKVSRIKTLSERFYYVLDPSKIKGFPGDVYEFMQTWSGKFKNVSEYDYHKDFLNTYITMHRLKDAFPNKTEEEIYRAIHWLANNNCIVFIDDVPQTFADINGSKMKNVLLINKEDWKADMRDEDVWEIPPLL